MRLLLLLCLFALPAGAQGLRALSSDQMRGVEAVGRLDIGTRAFCTGALVSPRLVLTAAHCLFADTNTPAQIDTMTFRAGLNAGQAAAIRRVRRMVIHPDYRHGNGASGAAIAADVALLELDRALDTPGIQPFPAHGRLARGAAVQVISYARGRSEAPSHEDGCTVLDRDARLLVLTCDVDFGASGSPVFVATPQGLRIVALISAMSRLSGQKVALAVPVEAGLDALTRAFARNPALPPVRKTLRPGAARSGTIRFVRPEN
ncbi:serine protease [Jannaschia sp. M317]|uniref:trypsin-like serine peptidase n=1 Tax=Jannaschia sp. M317 TaxID=2867011 RepID=UPI0021A7B3E6|nr:trypsin-like serine protease [Jannaschia sp. M317]UWQ17890.1 trypsin-like serine protease [Jannaschia sp. M317]